MVNVGAGKYAIVAAILYTALIYSVLQYYGILSPDIVLQHLSPALKVSNKHLRQRKYESLLNFTWLDEHPVYKRFYIEERKKKKAVTILIIVSSAPRRIGRRNGIRKTWWTQCVETTGVKPECIFMTDYQSVKEEYFDVVQEEKMKHGDIYFQHVESGLTFGRRFMSHMLFAVKSYDFDYFLRIDDDQFVCLERLLQDLPTPMVAKFHWGWIHGHANIRRPEESIIMFSRDVIETFLMQQPNKLLCHPLADQMIAAWLKELSIRDLLRHDSRIHNLPILSEVPAIRYMKDICHSFLSIHGTYVNDMALLWEHRGNSTRVNAKGNLLSYSKAYPIETPFEWKAFVPYWRYEPKLCITKPKWDVRRHMGNSLSYGGRE